MLRDIKIAAEFHDLGIWNGRSGFTPAELYSLCTGPVPQDPAGDSPIHPFLHADMAAQQATILTDSGAMLFKQSGSSTLWGTLKHQPGMQSTRILSGMGAGFKEFNTWIEALLFEYGLGPLSCAQGHHFPSESPSVGGAVGRCPTMEEVNAAGGQEFLRMSPSTRTLVIIWNGNDCIGNCHGMTDMFDSGIDNMLLSNFVGLANYFQKVLFLYSDDPSIWSGIAPSWEKKVRRVVSFLTANGIVCVSINKHYTSLRHAGCARNSWHYNAGSTCTTMWAAFLKSVLRWQQRGTIPWCWKQQVLEAGVLNPRSESVAEQMLPSEADAKAVTDILRGQMPPPPPSESPSAGGAGGWGLPSLPSLFNPKQQAPGYQAARTMQQEYGQAFEEAGHPGAGMLQPNLQTFVGQAQTIAAASQQASTFLTSAFPDPNVAKGQQPPVSDPWMVDWATEEALPPPPPPPKPPGPTAQVVRGVFGDPFPVELITGTFRCGVALCGWRCGGSADSC